MFTFNPNSSMSVCVCVSHLVTRNTHSSVRSFPRTHVFLRNLFSSTCSFVPPSDIRTSSLSIYQRIFIVKLLSIPFTQFYSISLKHECTVLLVSLSAPEIKQCYNKNYIQYFFHLVLFSLCAFLLTVSVLRVLLSFYVYLLYLMCICCILCVFVVPYVYLLYYVCIAVLTLDAELLARSQYPESPATGHLDTGFSWFPCVYKRVLRWFPSFQVATTCFSCSPPDLNSLVTFFFF